ncbi:MAG: DNA translocase FtsK 4TM domain-containing protein, partial [Deltaproteobacteria bacterium]|nr:DNA translocase FtsK 4TM domain-containing protein [Deltaproteobacteria bacterium]
MSKKNRNNSKAEEPAHPIRREIRGILFLLIALVLGVSLFSFHPGDPLFWNVTAHAGKAQNLFGKVGAHLAGGIFLALGFSSFWLVAAFLAMSF